MKFIDKMEGPGISYFHPIWIDIVGSGPFDDFEFVSGQVYAGHLVSNRCELDPIKIAHKVDGIGHFVSHDIRDESTVLYTGSMKSAYLKLDVRPMGIELSSWRGLMQFPIRVSREWLDVSISVLVDLLGIPADEQFFRE